MADATLSIDLLPEIDKRMLLKELKDAQKVVSGTKIPVDGSGGSGGGGTSSKTGGSGGGFIQNLLGGVSTMLTQIIGPLAFIAAAAALLKPALKMATNTLRLIAEMLRPIVDVIVISLQPMIAILRPILLVMRTLMAPFKQVAMQISGMSSQAAAAGNIGDSLTLALQAARTLIEPFVVVIVGEALKLTTTLFTANITNLINLVSGGIRILLDAIPFVSDELLADFDSIVSGAKKGLESANTAITDAVTAAEIALLDILSVEAKKRLDELRITYGTSLQNNIEAPLSVSTENQGAIIGNTYGDTGTLTMDITKGTEEAAKIVKGSYGSTGSLTTTITSGLTTMTEALSSFTTKVESFASRISSSNLSSGSRSRNRTADTIAEILTFGQADTLTYNE